MIGKPDWNAKTYEVFQQGSKIWRGKVKVWDGSASQYGVSGRRDAGAVAGNWAPGDTIQLTACVACVEPGI